MQTRGVCPDLNAAYSTPATPPAEPTVTELKLALAEKDAEIARLAFSNNTLRLRMLQLEVALINTLPHAALPEG
jgi:hypothetical protein